jgi:hypothetical protein
MCTSSSSWLKTLVKATTKQEDQENDDVRVVIFLVERSYESSSKVKDQENNDAHIIVFLVEKSCENKKNTRKMMMHALSCS